MTKTIGNCVITTEKDDFGVNVNATMKNIAFYKSDYDLNVSYDSEEEYEKKFDKDFSNWKNSILEKFEE